MFENGDTPIKIKPPEKGGFDRTEVAKLLMSIARRIRKVVNIPDTVEPNEDLEILVPLETVKEVERVINEEGYALA
jgi:hypothetical protein